MAHTYLETLTHFTHFLTAYIHTILYLRSLYPRTSFTTSRFHNTPVHQSRHPTVCEWITDAISAVREDLLQGTIARIGIVVYHHDSTTATGSAKIMERFMLDVSRFPVVAKGDRNIALAWEEEDDESTIAKDAGTTKKGKEKANAKAKQTLPALDSDVPANMSEQFRAAFIALTTRCARLAPLPNNCSFNICIELKDDPALDPPIRHPQPWVPAQPSLQKTSRKSVEDDGADREGEGADLGGVRVTPVRTVQAGVFRFETWIEEGRAKFERSAEGKESAKGSFVSEAG